MVISRYSKRGSLLLHTRSSPLALAIAAIYLAHAPTVQAQENAVPEKVAVTLEQVSVTASKRVESILEVAGAVSAVSGDKLEKIHANGVDDYVALLPGVVLETRSSPGQAKITMRGISAMTPGATTATYIDDVPYGSSNALASGELLSVPNLDPADLERVEVLKGPQGTLYGASSLGGLVKFVTRDPDLKNHEFRFSQDITSVAGGGAGYATRISGNVPLVEDKLALRVSAYTRTDPGFIDNNALGLSDVNKSRIDGVRANLLWKPTDSLSAKLLILAQNYRSNGKNAVDVDPLTLTPLYGGTAQSRPFKETNLTRSRLFALTVDYNLGWGSLTSASSYSMSDDIPLSDYTAYYGTDYGISTDETVRAGAGMKTDKFTQEVRLASQGDGPAEWIIGAFYQNENSGTNQFINPYNKDGALSFVGYLTRISSKFEEKALFGNLTWKFSEKLDLTLGYRYSGNDQDVVRRQTGTLLGLSDRWRVYSNQSSATSSTYMGALSWHINNDSILYARVASGYRPGGPRAMRPEIDYGGVSPTYREDSVWNHEVGYKASWLDNRATFEVAMFQMNWKDMQALMREGAFFGFGNAGDAVSRGIELQGAVMPFPGLTLSANAAYTDASIKESSADFNALKGDRLPYVPKWTGSINGDYAWQFGNQWDGFAGFSWRYKSSVDTEFSQSPYRLKLGSYSLLDVRVGVKREAYSASLYVKNVTNEHVFSGLNSWLDTSLPASFVLQQPRTVGLNFTWHLW